MIDSGARTHPTRKFEQMSLLMDPIVSHKASELSAASGGGGEPSMDKSESTLSSMIGTPSSDAIRLTSMRADRGITLPVGFGNVGVRYTSRAAVAVIRSR